MTPLETVHGFIDAITEKRIDDAMALLTEDCEYDNVPMGKNHGREATKALLEPMIMGCEEVDWPIHREAATGNIVMNERLDRFKMPFGWIEIPVTGVFEVTNDGLISLWRDYFDLQTYLGQMPPAE